MMDPAINTALVLILFSVAIYCVVKSLWDNDDDNP